MTQGLISEKKCEIERNPPNLRTHFSDTAVQQGRNLCCLSLFTKVMGGARFLASTREESIFSRLRWNHYCSRSQKNAMSVVSVHVAYTHQHRLSLCFPFIGRDGVSEQLRASVRVHTDRRTALPDPPAVTHSRVLLWPCMLSSHQATSDPWLVTGF